jgi:hypothetical protein
MLIKEEGAISTAEDGKFLLDGKGLERERKEILEGMNSEMAQIYKGS